MKVKKIVKKVVGKKQQRVRYFGITKIKRGEKTCWVAKQFKAGWSLGFGLNKRTVWLTSLRFADRAEVERVLHGASVVFVHLSGSEEKISKAK
jgi:hypothetical protein